MKELIKHLRRLVPFSVVSAVIYSFRFYRDFGEKRFVFVFTYQRGPEGKCSDFDFLILKHSTSINQFWK